MGKTIALNVALLPFKGSVVKAQQINNKLWGLCGNEYTQYFKFDARHHFHISLLQFYAKNDEETIRNIEKALDPILKNQEQLIVSANDLDVGGEIEKATFTLDLKVDSEAIKQLHKKVLDAVQPFVVKDGDKESFWQCGDVTDAPGEGAVSYVSKFVEEKSGDNFDPHATCAIGQKSDAKKIADKKSEFSIPLGVSIDRAALCHLGHYCTCRKILHEWSWNK